MPNLNTKLFCHSFQIQHGPVKKIPCISGINVVRLPEGLYLIWCFGQLSLKGQVLLAHVPHVPMSPGLQITPRYLDNYRKHNLPVHQEVGQKKTLALSEIRKNMKKSCFKTHLAIKIEMCFVKEDMLIV